MAAAGSSAPASWWLGLSNKRKGELLGILGQAGAKRVGGASVRRVELAVQLHRRGGSSAVARLLRARGKGVSGTALRAPKLPGASCLKPEKTKTKHTSYLNAHTGHDPRYGGPRGPPGWPRQRPPRVGSASLEGSRLPRAGSASLEGSRLPRAGSASLEGSSPPRSRLPHKHACSRTRVRAFNALTQQSRAIMRLGITPRCCSANSLGETHPRHCRELCGMASVSPVALCCPLPYG
jgi:hypothetical protein